MTEESNRTKTRRRRGDESAEEKQIRHSKRRTESAKVCSQKQEQSYARRARPTSAAAKRLSMKSADELDARRAKRRSAAAKH